MTAKSNGRAALTPSAAARRMRLHRERRRRGLRCLVVEVRASELEALVRRGFLRAETRNSARAIKEALYAFLDRTLGRRSDAQH